MKGRKEMKAERYLPPEVVTQILARVPVKSLLKFRCVSKPWLSLIDDPDFTKMHLQLYKNNRARTHIIAVEHVGIGAKYMCRFTVRRTDTLRRTAQLAKINTVYNIEGSCNGLLLLRRHNSYHYYELILWNPSVRKLVQLPWLTDFMVSDNDCYYYWVYILGFAPSSNDYKVVALKVSIKPCDEVPSMAVYTLSDNLWRVKSTDGIDAYGSVVKKMNGNVYFDGAVHWLVELPYGIVGSSEILKGAHLVSFNMDTEKFSYLELPGPTEGIYSCLSVIGESLGVFSISVENCWIWVKKQHGEEASWNLMFSGVSSAPEFNFFYKFARSIIFYDENSGSRFTCNNRSYNFVDHKIELLTKSLKNLKALGPYKESLVLCKECKGQNLSP